MAWQKKTIENTKQSVKKELDAIGSSKGPAARLRYALLQIGTLMNHTDDSSAQLRCYVYLISTLVHHIRYGGLSPKQVTRLVPLANAILTTQGIRPSTSKLGFLYSELHLALSQVYRRDGMQWKASWEHGVALHLSQRSSDQGGFLYLTLGICALRQGHSELALAEFERAIEMGLDARFAMRARLEKLKAFRLVGNYEAASELSGETLALPYVSPSDKTEITWETLCRGAQETGDIEPLIRSVAKGKPHHNATYALEAFLWSRIVKSRRWILRFPHLKVLTRGLKLKGREHGLLYECALTLESCYDSKIPFLRRLEVLGDRLNTAHTLFNLDTEILLWAASARWLDRLRSKELSALVVEEYRSRSLSLTQGRNQDVLGLLGDLIPASKNSIRKAA